MSALQNEIDKLKTLKESYSDLADSVANQKETNENILTLLTQFGESVLQEKVTVILNCQESIVWHDYAVSVTFEDGRVQAVPLSENGTCSFSIKIGQNYSVQLPVIGTFIAPELKTYTAISSAREIYWSYVAMGVFGMDELGRRYSIAQIEAFTDKSIIKYGGFTNEKLENAQKDDGTFGCGFMWKIGDEFSSSTLKWASLNVEFSQELLPFVTKTTALEYSDGEVYTQYIINEGIRLGVPTPAASYCVGKSIPIKGDYVNGFLISYHQCMLLGKNTALLNSLYTALGLTCPLFRGNDYANVHTSNQKSETETLAYDGYGDTFTGYYKTSNKYLFIVYPLPK